MIPVLVRHLDNPEPMLLIGFSGEYWAVVVLPGGRLANVLVADLRVERPTLEFPIGEGPWSRVDAEEVPV